MAKQMHVRHTAQIGEGRSLDMEVFPDGSSYVGKFIDGVVVRSISFNAKETTELLKFFSAAATAVE